MAIRELPKYESTKENYIHVDNTANFVNRLLKVDNCPERAGMDTETHFVPDIPGAVTKFIQDSPNNCPFGLSIFFGNEGYWITKAMGELQKLVDSPISRVFHNFKYDYMMLGNIGVWVPNDGNTWDTMIMTHMIDEEMECDTPPTAEAPDGGKKRSKALKDLAYHFFKTDEHALENLVDEYRKIIAANRGIHKSAVTYYDVMLANADLMKDYAIADTEYCYRLFDKLYPELINQELLNAYTIDMNATFAVADIERRGMPADRFKMKEDELLLNDVVSKRIKLLHEFNGGEFNIDSDRELVAAFQRSGVEWQWFTESGEYQTDKNIMKQFLSSPNECIAKAAEAVLEYRKAVKTRDTYITGVYQYIQKDGCVHPDYWICPSDFDKGSTVTGRLSSSNPNFQNQPKKKVEFDGNEFKVRRYYIPKDEHILVFMDADQEEYRLMGHYSQDPQFMQFIREGKDIHKAAATVVYGVPYDEVDDDLRSKMKSVNFGLIYALGNAGLANWLGHNIDEQRLRKGTKWLYENYKAWEIPPYKNIDPQSIIFSAQSTGNTDIIDGVCYFFSADVQAGIGEASGIKKKYFAQFPRIKTVIKDIELACRRRGYVKYWTGRRRHFKDPESHAYKAPNSLIQGGCGDILKVKLHECHEFLKPYKTYLCNNVHDEIAFMWHLDELDLIPEVNNILCDLPFRVPITWGIEWSDIGWGDKKPFVSVEKLKEALGI